VQLPNACGGLLFFFAYLPKGSGSATKRNKKKTPTKEYSPFVGRSYVEQMCIVVKSKGSLMLCWDRSVE